MKKILFIAICLTQFYAMSQQESNTATDSLYVCPPCNSQCDDLEFKKSGKCSHCNMELILKKDVKEMPITNKKSIAFYLQDGVEVLDFAGPMEVFSYAGFKVVTISKTRDTITSQGILKIIPDYSITDSPDLDILATFGGNSSRAFNDDELVAWVKNQDVKYHLV